MYEFYDTSIFLHRFNFDVQTDCRQSLFGFPSTHKSSSLMHCKGVPGQRYSVFSSQFTSEGNNSKYNVMIRSGKNKLKANANCKGIPGQRCQSKKKSANRQCNHLQIKQLVNAFSNVIGQQTL